jgi:MFS family permease
VDPGRLADHHRQLGHRVLASPDTLGMTSTEIGLIASVYLVGEIIGALVFGRLSDQLGR